MPRKIEDSVLAESERWLELFEITADERRYGITARRAARLLGSDSYDYTRQLLREGGVTRLARGRYSPEEVGALRVVRIGTGLIPREAGLNETTATDYAAIAATSGVSA